MPPRLFTHLLKSTPTRLSTTKSSQFIRSTTRYLFILATWVPAIIFFNDHVGELAPVSGPSMYPYLNEGFDRSLERDICWVNKIGRGGENGGLKRGMIVSLRSPTNPEIHATKRVVALPGDTVLTKSPYPVPTVTIPAGHIWVEGDGRSFGKRSYDSNHYGPVPINLVQGRLTWVVWPWRNWGEIKWWEFKSRSGVFKGSE